MNIDDITQRLRCLEEDVRKSYRNTTILDDVCTLESVEPNYKKGSFEQFASRYNIQRETIQNSSHFLLLGELGKSLARSEIELLLKEFIKNSPSKRLTNFSIKEIQTTVHELQNNDFYPHTVFIPSRYAMDVLNWNEQFHNNNFNLRSSLIIDSTTTLKVKYSSKYAKFDDIIITTKDANIWKFRSDSETNGRITVKFNWGYDDIENTSLLVRTIFQFKIQCQDANVILELPHNHDLKEKK